MIRFISIDDHPTISEALATVSERDNDLEMVGAFSSIESVPRPYRLPGAFADVAVLDLSLPGAGGTSAVAAVVGWGLVVVVFTATASAQTARDALQAGAAAVVSKVASTAQLLDSVRRAARGERFTLGIEVEPVPSATAPTPAEEYLLRCLTTETRSSVLASLTGVSVATVDNRISVLYDKAGLRQTDRTRAKLADWARRHGYVPTRAGGS